MECRNPDCEVEINTDGCYGGDVVCPECGWHHDTTFDTVAGLYVDGVCGPEEP